MSFTQTLSKIQCLSRNQIKYIVMVTMFIGHASLFLFPSEPVSYFIINQIIAPCSPVIFSYLMIEGTLHTHHLRQNICTLAIFAVISEPLFDYMIYGSFFNASYQNILFLYLAFSFFVFCCQKSKSVRHSMQIMRNILLIFFACILIVLSGIFNLDYGTYGLLALILGYYLQNKFHIPILTITFISIVLAFCVSKPGTLLAILVILLYNPDKQCSHTKLQKYSGYAFYPAHIAVIDIVKALMM